jgi:hypothetical protein
VFTRPTTDQVLEGVLRELQETVLPRVEDEPARVALQMMAQLLRGAAVRAAHEIAWMHEEIAEITEAAAPLASDAATGAALAELAATDASSLHLADVVERYSLAGDVLGCAVEAAYGLGNQELIDALRAVLEARSAREMQIVGQLDLVGRG